MNIINLEGGSAEPPLDTALKIPHFHRKLRGERSNDVVKFCSLCPYVAGCEFCFHLCKRDLGSEGQNGGSFIWMWTADTAVVAAATSGGGGGTSGSSSDMLESGSPM